MEDEQRMISARLLDALAMPFGGLQELDGKPIEQIEHCAEVLRDIVDAMDAGEVSTVCLQDIPPALHELTDPDVDERWN